MKNSTSTTLILFLTLAISFVAGMNSDALKNIVQVLAFAVGYTIGMQLIPLVASTIYAFTRENGQRTKGFHTLFFWLGFISICILILLQIINLGN